MPDSAEPYVHLTTLPVALGVTVGIVLAAFVVNRFTPRKRPHVRRAVIVHLLFLASIALSLGLRAIHADGPAVVARQVGEVLGLLAIVNLGALVVFDAGLAAVGVELPTIATDLAIGIAYIVSVLVSLNRFGLQLSGIVATSALMTTIVAFSLQSTLSNVVGGVALQIDGSIHVGDWVQLENGKQGKVKEIRWRYTVIETRDWDTMIVPNASLLAATVLILGKRENEPVQHRMWVHFNVDFRYPPGEVIRVVQDALRAGHIEDVADEPKPNCICYDFSRDGRESYAAYAVRYWLTDIAKDDPTSSRVRERIFAALKRAAIPLAVPAAMRWVEPDDLEHRERKKTRDLGRRLATLESVGFLKGLRPEELESLADNLTYAPFAAGETMTKQGATAHWLYIFTRGTAEVLVTSEGGQKSVAKIGAPGFFGEMGLMTGEPRTATVVACTDVECFRLDKDAFHRIITERPESARELSEALALRRVGLEAAKEDLDAEARERRLHAEQVRLLAKIQLFFGLVEEEKSPVSI